MKTYRFVCDILVPNLMATQSSRNKIIPLICQVMPSDQNEWGLVDDQNNSCSDHSGRILLILQLIKLCCHKSKINLKSLFLRHFANGKCASRPRSCACLIMTPFRILASKCYAFCTSTYWRNEYISPNISRPVLRNLTKNQHQSEKQSCGQSLSMQIVRLDMHYLST